MSTPEQQVARLFDELAPTYDHVGVDFFGPMARRLVDLLAPQPGERAIDLGCGRGAVTFALADLVGTTGEVIAGDLSPAMVEATRADTRHLPQVRVFELNASSPPLAPATADIVASAAVIFFLSDPASALSRWIDLLVPGGRLGLTTFGRQDSVWAAVDELFVTYLPPTMLDARTSGTRGPFASADGVDALVSGAGAVAVSTLVEPIDVVFDDVDAWQRWTMSVGQRRMWSCVPDHEKPRLVADAAALLEEARGEDGRLHLRQDVRYTTGRSPG
ncbi:methyltransferase domain-containing protein [Aeromicrobium sp.]|uniref:class I SAM-dependent methyltransferase n=1 Tax=Aeromicrobium sp. TaxID=1871063 RepID=UPI001999B1B1|nr:methyltransferase domain-containing protein [Aeromicrobium sp.]MBC7632338.1 methyltransferase domain-containing protein [Aeromicrobium sp.]